MILLIDNCSLLRLTHADAYSRYLVSLTNLINDGNIRLITHRLLLGEWENHKSKDKGRKLKKLGKVHGSIVSNGELLPSFINTEHIDVQQAVIDKLLENAIVVDTPEIIKNEFADRYRDRLAPFHNKLNSQNDWEVFGSVANYCLIHGMTDLYFISANDGEFGDPNDKRFALHPDLISRFNALNINYFSEIGDFLGSLESLILPKQFLSRNIIRNEGFSHKASMRKHMLDSLYMLFKSTYSEVKFVPTHLLVRFFPFKKKDTDHNHYSVFSLHSVPDELVAVFKAISLEGPEIKILNEKFFNGVSDVLEKLKFVLNRLNNNLIFRFTGKTSSEQVDIRYEDHIQCCCINCSFQRMDWQSCLSLLQDVPVDAHQRLNQAFIHYQFGNYDNATDMYLALREEFKSQGKFIWYFICQYNLRHLSFLLSGFFYPTRYTVEEILKLKEIDPIQESVFLKGHSDYDLLTYISDGSYFRIAVEGIGDLVTKIEDHYYSFLNGGWSSNSHVQLLICEFAELEAFTRGNGLIYDVYGNWHRLVSNFIKGLFASHAMRDTDNAAIESFDDYLLTIMINYAETAAITKYFYRYKLKDLAYERSVNGSDFNALASTLLAQQTPTSALVIEGRDSNTQFALKLQKMIGNMITLAALLEHNAYDLNVLAKRLLNFFKQSTYSKNHWSPLDIFLSRKGSRFEKKVLQGYISFLVDNLIETGPSPLTVLLKRNQRSKFGKRQMDKILKIVFGGNDGGEPEDRYELLSASYKRASTVQQVEIGTSIQGELDSNFNFKLYYRSVIHELIPFNQGVFNDQMEKINIDIKDYNMHSIASGTPSDYFPRLDDLLNICFKFDAVLDEKAIRKLKKAGLYYRWLIDMDNFDYTKFRFDWMNHYPTDFYLYKMSKSDKLRQKIIEFLRMNNDPLIEKLLIRITYFTKS